jgi:IQ calmodulin-binding motif
MYNKNKSFSVSKKTQNSLPMKEIFQQNQLTTEILRIIVSRSDDIAILKSISDKKTGKLRLQSGFAEKTLQETESREDWRLSKEEITLSQLVNFKLEAQLHKKQFEKQVKKMLKLNMQFDEDPSETEMNLSEIHVQKIMNIKIGPDNTIITYNEKGQALVTVPSGTVSINTWKDYHSQPVKLLDCFLSGDILNLYQPIYYCVKHSRNNYLIELQRQKQAIEENSNFLSPVSALPVLYNNIAVIITSKKSKSVLPTIGNTNKKTLSPARKSPLVPEPDFSLPIFKMFMDMNTEIDKSIKAFSINYFDRNNGKPRVFKTKDLVDKALRLRNYEKYSAVSPWAKNISNYPLNTVRTLIRLQIMPEILFDLENTYFEETTTFADRIKVIHSCIVLQKFYKNKKRNTMMKSAIVIQKHIRGYLGRKIFVLKKTFNFRKKFYMQRLRHWYPLLVNKRRELKSKRYNLDYNPHIQKIVYIQKNIRGYLARKIEVYWKKEFARLRGMKAEALFYSKKQKLWAVSLASEDIALSYSKSSIEDISSYIAYTKTVKKDEKTSNDLLKIKQISESDMRRRFLNQAKASRLLGLE